MTKKVINKLPKSHHLIFNKNTNEPLALDPKAFEKYKKIVDTHGTLPKDVPSGNLITVYRIIPVGNVINGIQNYNLSSDAVEIDICNLRWKFVPTTE